MDQASTLRDKYLLVFSDVDGTRAVRPTANSVRKRLWTAKATLLRANSLTEADTLLSKHQGELKGIFVIAEGSFDMPWKMITSANALRIPQFIATQSDVDLKPLKLVPRPVYIRVPLDKTDHDPIVVPAIDRFLRALSADFDEAQVSPLRLPPVRILLPDRAANASSVHCMSHEINTLKAISKAEGDGVTLRELGAGLNQDGMVQTLSLAINSLKRKGLIRSRMPRSTYSKTAIAERMFSLTSAGQHFLSNGC